MTADQVVARVAKDRAFYRNSGGGVTFSGGEPLAQPDFLAACLEGCRDEGISTAVSTSGYAPSEVLLRIAPLVNLFLFDLKLADTQEHLKWTGVPNDTILANLGFVATNVPVIVRVPLVPGCTDTPANLAGLADIIASIGVSQVNVAPAHGMGISKYADLGRDVPLDVIPPTRSSLLEAVFAFRSKGLICDAF
jgi:pyruvate formate lyase activating enzyme